MSYTRIWHVPKAVKPTYVSENYCRSPLEGGKYNRTEHDLSYK